MQSSNSPSKSEDSEEAGPSAGQSNVLEKTKRDTILLLSPINKAFMRVFKYLSIFCCALMFVVISLQVILRYGFNTGLTWAEELGRMAMIVLAFLSAPAAYYGDKNVRIDILPNLFPRRLNSILNILTHFAILVFAYYFIQYAYEFTVAGKTVFSTSIPGLTMNYIYVVMPVSFTILVLVIIEKVILDVKQLFT